MDIESNRDTDTCESWSLIEVNENEQISGTSYLDAYEIDQSVNECNQPLNSEEEKNDRIQIICENEPHSEHEPEEAVLNVPANGCGDSFNDASSNEQLKEQKDFQILYKGKGFQNDCIVEQKSSDCICNRTGCHDSVKVDIDCKYKDVDSDSDGISVISESEFNEFKVNDYETIQVCEKKVSDSYLDVKTHSNILKRKQKRLKLYYKQSSEESISSDFSFPDGNSQAIDVEKNNMQVVEYRGNPVYRHYVNNATNTVLRWAVGVICAGILCIALRHLLGLHDAEQTAGEMMESLKRLQMENVLLKTRLTQLSRAIFSRGSKPELKTNDESQICLDKFFDVPQNVREGNQQSDSYPIQDNKSSTLIPVRSADVIVRSKNSVNLNDLEFHNGQNSHITESARVDSSIFNISKYDDNYSQIPYSSTNPVQEVAGKFSPSKRKLEKMQKKVKKSDDAPNRYFGESVSLNKKPCSSENDRSENGVTPKQKCLAVREKDLNTFRWFDAQEKWGENTSGEELQEDKLNSLIEDNISVSYNFPQPEEYYKSKDSKKENVEGATKRERWRVRRRAISRDDFEFSLKPNKDEARGNNVYFSGYDTSTVDYNNCAGDGIKANEDNVEFYTKVKKEEKRRKGEKYYSPNYPNDLGKRDGDRHVKNSKSTDAKPSESYGTERDSKNGKRSVGKDLPRKYHKSNEYAKKNESDPEESGRRRYKWKGKTNLKWKETGVGDGCENPVGGKCTKFRELRNKKLRNLRKTYRSEKGKKWIVVAADDSFVLGGNRSESFDARSFNESGDWYAERTRGREKHRLLNGINEWQFYRGRCRDESLSDINWQFKRAIGRECSRSEEFTQFTKKKDSPNLKDF